MRDKITLVKRFKIYFLYAIDLGYLLQKKSREKLQELRAIGGVQGKIEEIFAKKRAQAWIFTDPNTEERRIQQRARQAEKKGGKNIWSDLFFIKQVPIRFKFITEFTQLLSSSHSDGWQDRIKFKRCVFRIFKEGILVFSFEFEQGDKQLNLDIDSMIEILAKLEDVTFESFTYIVGEIVNDWSNGMHPFQNLGLSLRASVNLSETISKSSIKHSCIFLEGLSSISEEQEDFSESIKRSLLGILNKTSWYKKYSNKYLDEAFEKNVGYRKDEIYLTDKNATLVLLKDYWEDENPLRFYMDDLILAIQMQVAKQAYLNFFLQYIQSNSYSQRALEDPASEDAVKLVLQSRNILTLLQESTDIDSLIVHGFTRKFLERLVDELKIGKYLTLIRSRIDNISDAIQLKSAYETSKQSITLDKMGIKLAVVGFILTGMGIITALNLDTKQTLMGFMSVLISGVIIYFRMTRHLRRI